MLVAVVALCLLACGVLAEPTVFAFSSVEPAASVEATVPLFVRDMEEADAAGATWLLFPEFSLFRPSTREAALAECRKAPATLAALGKSMTTLKSVQFALVNLCVVDESTNGTLLFNANLLLSSVNGSVVATYRKSHPWFTAVFDKPAVPDLVVFRGFGFFMCYDIAFNTPAVELRNRGIDKFLYNAAIPIVGSAVFRAWSLLHNATLLAADVGNGGAYVRGSRLGEQSGNLVLAKIDL